MAAPAFTRRRAATLAVAGSVAAAWLLPGAGATWRAAAPAEDLSRPGAAASRPAEGQTRPPGEAAGRSGPGAEAPGRPGPSTSLGDGRPPTGPRIEVAGDHAAGGGLVVDGGADGLEPTLTGNDLEPGDRSVMTLRLRNAGARAARATLAVERARETPGPNGGRLGARLRLTVVREGARVPLWEGALTALPPVALGVVRPGATATYTLGVHFPDGGPPPGPHTGDNAFQGSGVFVRYALRALASG